MANDQEVASLTRTDFIGWRRVLRQRFRAAEKAGSKVPRLEASSVLMRDIYGFAISLEDDEVAALRSFVRAKAGRVTREDSPFHLALRLFDYPAPRGNEWLGKRARSRYANDMLFAESYDIDPRLIDCFISSIGPCTVERSADERKAVEDLAAFTSSVAVARMLPVQKPRGSKTARTEPRQGRKMAEIPRQPGKTPAGTRLEIIRDEEGWSETYRFSSGPRYRVPKPVVADKDHEDG